MTPLGHDAWAAKQRGRFRRAEGLVESAFDEISQADHGSDPRVQFGLVIEDAIKVAMLRGVPFAELRRQLGGPSDDHLAELSAERRVARFVEEANDR